MRLFKNMNVNTQLTVVNQETTLYVNIEHNYAVL